jgi:concentrative nucleoside transporter, CNT family
MILNKLITISGIILILFFLWLLSEGRKKFPWRVVLWGLSIQLSITILVLYNPNGAKAFQWIGLQITYFLDFSKKGAYFLFGNIFKPENMQTFGMQFGIMLTCTIVFFTSFISILYHYGIMQRIVYSIGWIMHKTMKTSGIESLTAAANVFLGQVEAAVLVRHYLPSASRSEINAIMVGGFATIAAGVMAAYIQMGIYPEMLILASLMSAPGSLILSKILIPQTAISNDMKGILDISYNRANGLMDAIGRGSSDGMKLALNIIAMLIAFLAIIAIVDTAMNQVHYWFMNIGINSFPRSLKEFFGFILQPFAYLAGIPVNEAKTFGSLLGTKISFNEFLAYADLSQLIRNHSISERTAKIATIALCGFSNFGSIAMQIGGIGALAPEKKSEIAKLGLKAMLLGAIVNILSAMIVSLFI